MNESTKWPQLHISDWSDTCATLHRWTQIVGKIRTRQMAWTNHSWHVTLYVTPRGLTTMSIPFGSGSFQIDFDFVDHRLKWITSAGESVGFGLEPMSVAEFNDKVQSTLHQLGIPVEYHGSPNEVDPSIPFKEDNDHASYDADSVDRFRLALVRCERVMSQFRSGFVGKCSPVHFFWGSFDMAVTRFSGRKAPKHPGGFPNMPDWITHEAYSHEVSSCGYWPGGGDQDGFFYSYAYPGPEGFSEQPVQPEEASWHSDLGEYVLPYSAIQNSDTPDQDLLDFFESTYTAAAKTANWDREALEWNGPNREQ